MDILTTDITGLTATAGAGAEYDDEEAAIVSEDADDVEGAVSAESAGSEPELERDDDDDEPRAFCCCCS